MQIFILVEILFRFNQFSGKFDILILFLLKATYEREYEWRYNTLTPWNYIYF